MPRKQNETPGDVAAGFSKDVKFRSYKNDGSGFDEFNEGEELVGVLVSIRDHQITDRRTKKPKEIRVYSIRVESGDVKKIGGRALLDRMFDDIMDENGGFVVENRRYSGPGYAAIQGKVLKLNRGDDAKTSGGDRMGTYEIGIEED